MQITRRVPHIRSFKASVITVFAIFVLSNITEIRFFQALAPTATAKVIAAIDPNAPVFIPSDVPTSGDANLDQIIFKAADKYGVDPRLVHAVILQESRYVADAKSGVGAQGLMQLMPDTAKRFGCDDSSDEQKNVEAGTKYLRALLKRFDGDVSLALAGYNAGEGNVDKYKGVPPFPETQKYVRNITGNYGKTYHPVLAPEDAHVAFHLDAEASATE
ncbi:MAG: lytic transglycosylase domain-containing protein [Pyrinomonadaceae bacterium]